MRDSVDYFIKRNEIVAAFGKLISPEAKRLVLMVDGLSGTGKSVLIDWLRKNESKNIRTARILLSPALQERELLRSLVSQLNPAQVENYEKRLDESNANRGALVSVTQSAEGRLGGSVDDATQTITLNLQEAGGLMELQRRSERLDALTAAIRMVDVSPWVIFFDESEHLGQPDLNRAILQEFIPALRARFQNVRLYFTGQSVPFDAFERFEYQRLALGVFDRKLTTELLRNANVDERLYERIFELTGGHPLLLGMWLDAEENEAGERDIEEEFDEVATTRWIYDRVVSRFTDPNVRRVAANLSLLEWFDLGLLRSIYDEEISEDAFEQMIRRSFIKSSGKGRWRCHDIVRKRLPAHRWRIDPEGCREVYRRSAEAFQSRLQLEEERAGTSRFSGRLDITLALFNSLHGYSADKAETFITREIARQVAMTDTDYVFALARYLDSIESPRFGNLAGDVRALLDTWSAQSSDTRLVATMERLGRAAEEGNEPDIAATLYQGAAVQAAMLHRLPDAIVLARRAVELEDTDRTRSLLGRLLIDLGDYAGAEQFLTEWEAREKSAALYMTRAALATEKGDFALAVRELTDVLAAFPDSAIDVYLRLADLAMRQDDTSTAMRQLDAVLEEDPENYTALNSKAEILVAEGKVKQAGELFTRLRSGISRLFLDEAKAAQALAAPGVRERILFEFESDPQSVPLVAVLRVATTLAVEGNLEKVDKLIDRMTATWPEAFDLGTVTRARAHITARQFDKAVELLEPLAARKIANHDLYQLLEISYGALGREDDQMRANRVGRESQPALADMFDGRYAGYLIEKGKLDEALEFLERSDREAGSLGPNRAFTRGAIYNLKGNPEQALQTIEEVIYTDDITSVPLPLMITLRLTYALMLRGTGERAKAVEFLDRTVALFPNVASVIVGAAHEYLALGEEARLRALMTPARNAGVYQTVLSLSVSAIAARKPTIEQLLAELRRTPDAGEIVCAVDRILTLEGRVSEVAAIVAQMERIAPGLVYQTAVLQRRAIAGGGDVQIAESRDAVAADPENATLKIGLAEILAARGSLDEAMSVVDDAAAVQPAIHAFVTGWKAVKLVEAKRIEEAVQLLEPFIQMEGPVPAELMEPIALLLDERNDTDTAIAFYRKMALDPVSRESAIHRLALLLIGADKPEEALAEMEAFGDESSIPLGLSKAKALDELGRSDEASLLLGRLVSRDHLSPLVQAQIHVAQGNIQRKNHAYEEAIQSYEAAVVDDEAYVEPHLGMSLAHEAAGNAEDAYIHLKAAIALDPSIASNVADRLRELRVAFEQRSIASCEVLE
ncbi:MAG: hypothetical protein QOK37_4008 [Thermoanaerobaculia bacterium]|jgi:tetratricopeptide (TPR) repeat protein|nr:hypothetical protein [Thermoanaerobaculia bacterium]